MPQVNIVLAHYSTIEGRLAADAAVVEIATDLVVKRAHRRKEWW